MIETRIHHIDPNFPEKDDVVSVEVKFMDPVDVNSQHRFANVLIKVDNPGDLTLNDIHRIAIQNAHEFLREILKTS